MIKRFVFLLLVCFMIFSTYVVYADVISPPPDNAFYALHSSECVKLNRSFYVNGKSGYISLKKKPGSNFLDEVRKIKNGDFIYITYTYNYKGKIWGLTDSYGQMGRSYEEKNTGWVLMSDLLLMYDSVSFTEDHKDEFHTYTGSYELFGEENVVYIWTWPGSGQMIMDLDKSERDVKVECAYTDGEGREWGSISSHLFVQNVWVCLSDPSNSQIPAFNPYKPVDWQSEITDVSKSVLSIQLIIIILVIILVIGTAILIRVFWKPNKSR